MSEFATERWRSVGRLLPRDIRERIFDPAFSDLVYQRVTKGSESRYRMPFGVTVVATYLGCFPVVIPRIFVKNGKLTWLSRIGLAVVIVLLTAPLVIRQMASDYYSQLP